MAARNGRSQGSSRRAPARGARGAGAPSESELASERGVVSETVEGRMVPGTSMVLHRWPTDRAPLAHTPWINATGEPVGEIAQDRIMREIATQLASWQEDQKLRGRPGALSVFDRNAYLPPDNVFDIMRMARMAVENDDVIGGAADTTESLAMDGVHFEGEDLSEVNWFKQWAEMVGWEEFNKSAWRELFTESQVVVGRWWGYQTFTDDRRTPPKVDDDPQTGKRSITLGNRRRKKFEKVYCPLALTTIDGTRVIPVGNFMFGQEQLAWHATEEEMRVWQSQQGIPQGVANTQVPDALMSRLFLNKYEASSEPERQRLRKLGVDPERLLLFNPEVVFRYTLTRPSYRPWADIRLKRAFRFLDLKQQLLAADRTALIGTANYILLVRKGEKERPATQPELENLNANFQYIAKLPVVIGDHTLQIDIVSPKTDFTLQDERYATVQMQILHTVYSTFRAEGRGAGRSDTTYTVGRAVAKGIQSRRNGVATNFRENIVRYITEHPFNTGKFTTTPFIAFTPRNVALEIDQATMQAIVAGRASGDISRRTYLEELGLDIDVEFTRKVEETEYYDDVFQSHTPFDSPANNPAAAPNGGGALPPGQGGGGRPPAKKAAAKKTPATPPSPAPTGGSS